MQVTYCKEKTFPDGSTELVIKDGYKQTFQDRLKARTTRLFNEIEKRQQQEKLTAELNKTTFLEPRKRHKLELLLNIRDLNDIKRSARRARQELYDVCKCNDFKYFVTLTFDKEKITRKDDERTRRRFSHWANYMRRQFPALFYVATPEYHKKGGLHFHLLIGGTTLDELKAAPAYDINGRPIIKNGKQIYNIGAWRVGFSTLSIIENIDAAKHYICKYITKQRYEERFFNKRRYYCSHNIARPTVERTEHTTGEPWALNLDIWRVSYLDEKKRYGVFVNPGEGVVDTEYNAPNVRQMVSNLCARAAQRERRERFSVPARARAGACPYLTIGTLLTKNIADRQIQAVYPYKTELERRLQEAQLLHTTPQDSEYLREIGLTD